MVQLAHDGAEVARWPLDDSGRADLTTVEMLLRLQLAARRLGYRMALIDPDPELLDLIELVGLSEVLGAVALSAGQVSRQPEDGK